MSAACLCGGGLELHSDCPVLEVNLTVVPTGWDLVSASLGWRGKRTTRVFVVAASFLCFFSSFRGNWMHVVCGVNSWQLGAELQAASLRSSYWALRFTLSRVKIFLMFKSSCACVGLISCAELGWVSWFLHVAALQVFDLCAGFTAFACCFLLTCSFDLFCLIYEADTDVWTLNSFI